LQQRGQYEDIGVAGKLLCLGFVCKTGGWQALQPANIRYPFTESCAGAAARKTGLGFSGLGTKYSNSYNKKYHNTLKKKIFIGIAAVAVAIAVAVNVNLALQGNDLSALANVEALAGENGPTVTTCLGLWGECTTPSGAKAKSPLIEVNL
jgi:hypothetical protein